MRKMAEKLLSSGKFSYVLGVVCIEKCFRNFEIVVGSAFCEMSRFSRFYVRDSVYAHTVLINDFNRVVSPFRQSW